jgi:hypothetical protein
MGLKITLPRHHAVSVALSNPTVPLEAASAYFGWMSPKMVQRDYHVNQAAMRVVAAALDKKPDPPKKEKPKRKAPVVETCLVTSNCCERKST